MPRHFNLVPEPWIPVLYDDGTSGRVGWRDLIAESPRIIDVVTDPPHVYGIVVRLATAMVLRTQGAPLGEQSPKSWRTWGEKALADGVAVASLDAYFEEWGDRFWLLDDEHPFLQDSTIATECDKRASTNKFLFNVASGRNHLWWTKTLDDDAPALPFDIAAMALLAQWGYAAGGGCANRRGVPKAKQAPQRRYSQFIPRGANLFETLLMSCTPAFADAEFAERDVPVWEVDPGATLVPGQMSRLTASTRGFLLFGDADGVVKVVSTWGDNQLSLDFWAADVFMESRVAPKDREILPHRLGMTDAAWREAPAVLAERRDDAERIPPVVLDAQRNPLGSAPAFIKSGVTVVTHFTDATGAVDLGWSRSDLPDLLGTTQEKDRKRYYEIAQFCAFTSDVLPTTQWLITKAGAEGARAVPDGDLFVRHLWSDAEELFYGIVGGLVWSEAALDLLDRIIKRFDVATENVSAPARLLAVLRTQRSLTGQIYKAKKKFNLINEEAEVS